MKYFYFTPPWNPLPLKADAHIRVHTGIIFPARVAWMKAANRNSVATPVICWLTPYRETRTVPRQAVFRCLVPSTYLLVERETSRRSDSELTTPNQGNIDACSHRTFEKHIHTSHRDLRQRGISHRCGIAVQEERWHHMCSINPWLGTNKSGIRFAQKRSIKLYLFWYEQEKKGYPFRLPLSVSRTICRPACLTTRCTRQLKLSDQCTLIVTSHYCVIDRSAIWSTTPTPPATHGKCYRTRQVPYHAKYPSKFWRNVRGVLLRRYHVVALIR